MLILMSVDIEILWRLVAFVSAMEESICTYPAMIAEILAVVNVKFDETVVTGINHGIESEL
jgi:hypothetical protein